MLSAAKHLARRAKMLRCAQHDRVLDLPVPQHLYYVLYNSLNVHRKHSIVNLAFSCKYDTLCTVTPTTSGTRKIDNREVRECRGRSPINVDTRGAGDEVPFRGAGCPRSALPPRRRTRRVSWDDKTQFVLTQREQLWMTRHIKLHSHPTSTYL